MMTTFWRFAVVCSVAGLATACASQRDESEVSIPPNAGVYKIGNPYEIDGTWYYPREQPDYDETGIASWYGPTFYGKRTANGELFTRDSLGAAHRTLPMPVNVRVTNLENGRSLIVRVNDRGPYAKGRIIDVTERAAKLLGFIQAGTAKVRVTFVSRADLPNGQPQPSDTPPEIASAVPAAPVAPVDVAKLNNVPGAAVAPAGRQHALPAPPAPSAAGAELATSQPTGQVTQVPVPAVTHIYVQVGAFNELSNARRVIAHLGNGLRISAIARNGQKLYRVRLGPFDQVSDADQALARIAGLGSNDARIVVDQ
jgi:rare lipoprotein A